MKENLFPFSVFKTFRKVQKIPKPILSLNRYCLWHNFNHLQRNSIKEMFPLTIKQNFVMLIKELKNQLKCTITEIDDKI